MCIDFFSAWKVQMESKFIWMSRRFNILLTMCNFSKIKEEVMQNQLVMQLVWVIVQQITLLSTINC